MLPCLHYDRISNADRFSIATTRVIASFDSGDPSDHRVSCGCASESIHRSPLSNVIFAEKLPWHDMTKNNVSAPLHATQQPLDSPSHLIKQVLGFPKKQGRMLFLMNSERGQNCPFSHDTAEAQPNQQTDLSESTKIVFLTATDTFQSTHGL